MIEIKCPNCEAVGRMSLAQTMYEGPYRCWKCRSLFTVILANNNLQSCIPLSEEEFQAWLAEQDTMKENGGD